MAYDSCNGCSRSLQAFRRTVPLRCIRYRTYPDPTRDAPPPFATSRWYIGASSPNESGAVRQWFCDSSSRDRARHILPEVVPFRPRINHIFEKPNMFEADHAGKGRGWQTHPCIDPSGRMQLYVTKHAPTQQSIPAPAPACRRSED